MAGNLFPDERKGSLDAEKLKTLGLTKQRMMDCDAAFFYQLLLPFCDPKHSGIVGDPRLAFYTDVLRFSNLYAQQNDLGTGPYGHHFDALTLEDLIHFDGVVIRNGVHGRNDSAINKRWKKSSVAYDAEIDNSISHRRWLQVKRNVKLCDNTSVAKRGEPGYDPAYKYDLIWKVLVHNVNAISFSVELDLCGDETTFGHGGYGEQGSGLWSKLLNKPFTKGGQTVLVSDVHRVRPRAYSHRHKLHTIPEYAKDWSAAQGPLEAARIATMIKPMVVGQEQVAGVPQLFKSHPHFTWDNHFSGDTIMEWLGSQGFGATMTCCHHRLPAGVPGHFFTRLEPKWINALRLAGSSLQSQQ
jgi:hypothetical protein